jgi:hypothetical protein
MAPVAASPPVMPALVAGIHAFPYGDSASKTWKAGTSPAMTPNRIVTILDNKGDEWTSPSLTNSGC